MGGKGSGRRRQTRDHGLAARYGQGCRCAACRAAWAAYCRVYRRRTLGRPGLARRRQYYAGRDTAMKVALTPLAHILLDAAKTRTTRSRAEIVEHLVRLHAGHVEFAEPIVQNQRESQDVTG